MIIKERDVVLVAKDDSGNKIIQMPVTRVENVEGAIKTVNGTKPDSSGNVGLGDVLKADGSIIATNTIRSNYSEGSWISGAQGKSIIKSTLEPGAYVPVYCYDCKDGGSIAIGGYLDNLEIYYCDQANKDSGTNIQNWTVKFASTGAVYFSKMVYGQGFQSTSDKRLKENIKPLVKIDFSNITGCSYYFKSDKTKTEKIGLIAQNVQKSYPQAVMEDDKGYLSIDYNAIVALLVNKVKTLESQIKDIQDNVK